jgi:hypothetical protein
MATITATDMRVNGAAAVAVTTLTASDTFTYREARDPVLVLRNGTGGALTVTLDGADGSSVPVAGIGAVSVASGFSTGSIAAGAMVAIPLNAIKSFLQGVIAVTGGTGISASLLEF